MKKLTALGLLLLALSALAFADDAKVMPMMVGRVYAVPTYAFALGGYDKDGSYDKFGTGKVQAFILSFALEYGVIDWITAAVQWTPGLAVWSDVSATPAGDKSNINGLADLFVGAKIQLIGEKAPVKNSMFRTAVALGVIIPLPGKDLKEELVNKQKGEDFTAQQFDNHVFGAGARLYFDWIINEHFFINVYNETLFFPIKKDLEKDSLTFVGMQAQAPTLPIEGEINYKYKLTFEIEPVFTTPLAQGISLSAGLPINFLYKPAADVTIEGLTGAPAPLLGAAAALEATEPTQVLSVKPNVSVFITSTPLPLEFKLQYGLPVWAKSYPAAQHQISFQARVYFALPGRPQ